MVKRPSEVAGLLAAESHPRTSRPDEENVEAKHARDEREMFPPVLWASDEKQGSEE